MADHAPPGFFGKLPSRGDFVSRRLAPAFVEPWDAWLQSALASSRNALGSQWLDIYLTSPVWRFALSPGVCGDEGYVGVVIPSVDKVGRYFPLAAAAPVGGRAALALAFDLGGWFAAVEELLLATLAEPPLALETFDEQLARMSVVPVTSLVGAGGVWPRGIGAGALHWHCNVPPATSLRAALAPQLAQLAGDVMAASAFWWTEGSERVAPCVLITQGLPDADAFGAMLDGGWDSRGWHSGELRADDGPRAAEQGTAHFEARSAAVSDAGKVRQINEDSAATRDAAGVWLVADGLGGHAAGDIASGMVASVVDELGVAASLAARVDDLSRLFRVVNRCLRMLVRDAPQQLVASTVAALATFAEHAAVVWAGDSRVYRLRAGALEQISRDHSDASPDKPEDRAVTRAVGGLPELVVEVQQIDVQHGDRFLLCTDGLYGEVGDADMIAALSLAEPRHACDELKALALRGSARDNLTAVVVFVTSAGGITAEGGYRDG